MGRDDENRVWCLYRVSTKNQVEENDIPMQRKACRSFCMKQGWSIRKEYQEQGVSGYSISLDSREIIQEIKEAACRKEFDIFLVYMFDRVGRKEFEVPAFLRFLFDCGIKVWSTQEGEQRFDSEVDSLTAMLRSFSSQRESAKISIRVRTKMSQMALAGQYRGGRLPYGYKTQDSIHKNRKDEPVKELMIDQAEAAVVRLIFDKRVNEKMSTHAIARMLCEMDLPGEKHLWRSSSVSSLLGNRIYIGQIKFGNEFSMPFEHLQIISKDIFDKAQKMKRRICTSKAEDKPQLPQFYDILYCECCNGHLIYDVSHKKTTAYGKLNSREIYRCYNSLRYSSPCNGQRAYSKTRVDRLVMRELQQQLQILNDADEELLVTAAAERYYMEQMERLQILEDELKDCRTQLAALKEQAVKVSEEYGVEATTNIHIAIADQVSTQEMIKEKLSGTKRCMMTRAEAHKKMQKELARAKSVFGNYDQIPEDELKDFAAVVFQKVLLGRGYTIRTELAQPLRSFLPCDSY